MGSALSSRKIGSDGDQLSDMTLRIRDQEESELADEGQRRARELISGHREQLDALAESLLAHEVLERPEIDRVMGEAAIGDRGLVTGLGVAAATESEEPGAPSK
jgi:ATP-dependent Zn protease